MRMTVRGKIKKGKVILDDPGALPEGTEVEVRPVKKRKPVAKPRRPAKARKAPPRSLADRLRNFIGKAKGLPPDMSANLDHYLYGLPKTE
jgi:hypothetical protein